MSDGAVDVERTWELFDEVAAAVRDAVAGAALEPEAPGDRPGQYRLDLVADRVAVSLLVDAGFGVLSEESGRHFPERPVCVVVDPVDGSTNAGRGLPLWATSLCAVDAEGAAVATVVDQSRGLSWRGARGRGAEAATVGSFEPLRPVAREVPMADAVISVNGRSDAWPATRQFRAYGCLAVELCTVASGGLDGYVNLDGDAHGPWDYLGGLLVLREAGGVVADRQGRELVTVDGTTRRDLVAACGAELLAAMMSG